MSHKGFPSLGPDYVGPLHRHPAREGHPEMKNHVVVDLEDWQHARRILAGFKITVEDVLEEGPVEPPTRTGLDVAVKIISDVLQEHASENDLALDAWKTVCDAAYTEFAKCDHCGNMAEHHQCEEHYTYEAGDD